MTLIEDQRPASVYYQRMMTVQLDSCGDASRMRSWCATGVLVAAALLSGCRSRPVSAATPLTIATGSTSGVYFPLGNALAKIYNARLPGIQAAAIATGASPYNVKALEDGTADVAFVLGDVAYLAYAEGTRLVAAPHPHLRSMAVLYSNALHFIVLPNSSIRGVGDLAGKRVGIGVGTSGPGRSKYIDLLIAAYGVDPATVGESLLSFDEVIAGLRNRTLDLGIISAGYPVSTIETASREGLRFLELTGEPVDRVREQYPFFIPIVIPPHTYPNQKMPVETLGADNLLVCRQGLDEELVYRLTRTLFEALPELGLAHPSARLIDPEQASATPIPLHAGAARYYRERELLLY